MTEKAKNHQPRKRPYRKIAAYGCGFFLLLSCALISLGARLVSDMLSNFEGFMGPGWMDDCTSFDGVHHDFDLSGRVIDGQGLPVDQARVEIGSEGAKSCIDELTSYSTITNQNGEFLFRPALFAYSNEFFIAVTHKGCQPSVLYNDTHSTEIVTIVIDCATTSPQ